MLFHLGLGQMRIDIKKNKNDKIDMEDLAARLWDESWTYIKTVVDTVREPFLVLDKNLCVMAANESFYKTFQVNKDDTEKKLVYELGNKQWNLPQLRKLLEDILPKNTFFKGFEVTHDFPVIGHKVMILNARRIYRTGDDSLENQQIILLAMEDVTEIMGVAEMLANHTKNFELKIAERTNNLEIQIKELEEEINELKNR